MINLETSLMTTPPYVSLPGISLRQIGLRAWSKTFYWFFNLTVLFTLFKTAAPRLRWLHCIGEIFVLGLDGS